MKKTIKIILASWLMITVVGLLIPQNLIMPVENATSTDYNHDTFWYYPWGKSITHKGVDVFAKIGTPVNSSTNGFVMLSKNINVGGNVVLILGPKWRVHYYAHLDKAIAKPFTFVKKGENIGTVGDSGNAKGKPAHLHYSIMTIIPYPWRIDNDHQGWKKMCYLNPIDFFED